MESLKNILKKSGLEYPNQYLKSFDKYILDKEVIGKIDITNDLVFYIIKTNRKEINLKNNKSWSTEKDVFEEMYFSSKIEGLEMKRSIKGDVNKNTSILLDAYEHMASVEKLDESVLFEIANYFNQVEEENIFDVDYKYRKNKVGIYKTGKNGIDELIHQGIESSVIKEAIDSLFVMLNSYGESNFDNILIASYSHVIFEYIHPYYDANGRIGRLLMNWQLDKLENNFANNVSRVIFANRNKYYEALYFSQKTKILNYFTEFLIEACIEANKMSIAIEKINSKFKLSNSMISFIKELIAVGILEREISYSRYKEYFGKQYSKASFFKNVNILVKSDVLIEETRKNKKFYKFNN